MALRKKVASIISNAKVDVEICSHCKEVFTSEKHKKEHKCDKDENNEK